VIQSPPVRKSSQVPTTARPHDAHILPASHIKAVSHLFCRQNKAVSVVVRWRSIQHFLPVIIHRGDCIGGGSDDRRSYNGTSAKYQVERSTIRNATINNTPVTDVSVQAYDLLVSFAFMSWDILQFRTIEDFCFILLACILVLFLSFYCSLI